MMFFKGFNLKSLILPFYYLFFLFCCSTGFIAVAESAVSPDDYEDDDSYSSATYFVLDSEAQVHNSHDAGDIDWIKFSAVAGEDHTITVSNAEENSNVYIELYDDPTEPYIKRRNDRSSGEGETLEWKQADAGIYYVKIGQANEETYGEGTGYEVKVELTGTAAAYGIVYGKVEDSSTRLGIDDVEISSSANSKVLSVGGGYYTMTHIEGTFRFSVRAAGYPTQIKTLTIVNGGMEEVNFNLDPTPGPICFLEVLLGGDSREVLILRSFRNHVLEKNAVGRGMIKLYYELSPKLLELVEGNESLKRNIKQIIIGIVPVFEEILN